MSLPRSRSVAPLGTRTSTFHSILPPNRAPPEPPMATSELSAFFSWHISDNLLLLQSLHNGYALLSQKFALLDHVANLQLGLMLHDDSLPMPKTKIYHIFARMNIKDKCTVDLLSRFRISVRQLQPCTDRRNIPTFPPSLDSNVFDEYTCGGINRPKMHEKIITELYVSSILREDREFVEGYQSFSFRFNKESNETPRYPLILNASIADKNSTNAQFLFKRTIIIDCELVVEIQMPIRLFEIDDSQRFVEDRPKRYMGDKTCDWHIFVGNEASHSKIPVHEHLIPPDWFIYRKPSDSKNIWLEKLHYQDVLAVLKFIYYKLVSNNLQHQSMNDMFEHTKGLEILDRRLNEIRSTIEFHKRLNRLVDLMFATTRKEFEDTFMHETEFNSVKFVNEVRPGMMDITVAKKVRDVMLINVFVQNYMPGIYILAEPSAIPNPIILQRAVSKEQLQSPALSVSPHQPSKYSLSATLAPNYTIRSLRGSSTEPESSISSVSSGHNPSSSGYTNKTGDRLTVPPNVTVGDSSLLPGQPRPRSQSQSTTHSVSSMELDTAHSDPSEPFAVVFDSLQISKAPAGKQTPSKPTETNL